MGDCGSNLFTELTWEQRLAQFRLKRHAAFYDDESAVIDAEYSRLDGGKTSATGCGAGNGQDGEGDKAVNDPDLASVIWQPQPDGNTAQEPDADTVGTAVPPFDWYCEETGVYDVRFGKHFICGPLKVTYQVEINGDYYRQVKYRNFRGKDATMLIAEGDLLGSSKILMKWLANRGLHIAPGKHMELQEYLLACKPGKIADGVQVPGWEDRLGNGLIYVMPDQSIIMPVHLRAKTPLVPTFHYDDNQHPSKGDLSEWIETVARPACRTNAGILALSVGIAPVLLKFAPEEINFMIHFHGKTTKGKSTLIQIASSIWGLNHKQGSSWNGTEKGLLDKAKQYRDRLLFLDELGAGDMDPQAMSKMVYSLAGGQDRLRSTAGGKAIGGESFRTLVVSSGEFALEAGMSNGNKQPNRGTVHRCIDIEIRDAAAELLAPERGPFIDGLKQATNDAYGTAGKAFLTKLVERFPDAKSLSDHLRREMGEVLTDFGVPINDPVMKRSLERFALIVVAGELAVDFGLMPLTDSQDVRRAISTFARAWYGKVSPQAVQTRYLERIRDFILKSRVRFQDEGKSAPANRVGWYLYHNRIQKHVYAFTALGLHEAAQDRDVQAVAKALQDAQLLFQNNAGKYQARVPVPAGRYHQRVDAYTVLDDILDYTADQD